MSARNHLASVLLFCAGGAVGAGVATLVGGNVWWKQEQGVQLGSPLFQSDASEVRVLLFTTEDLSLAAQRSTPGAPFEVQLTFAGHRAPERCTSSPDVAGVLRGLSVAKATALLSLGEMRAKYPEPLGSIELKDAVWGEPLAPWLLFGSNDKRAIAVQIGSEAFQADISPELVQRLRAGCSKLAKQSDKAH